MKCRGEFIFKSLEEREAGTFTNDKGENINYPSSFVLKLDEINENGINERKLKFPKENTELANRLNRLEPYTKIQLEFDVMIYGSQARITPTSFVDVQE